MLTTTDTSVPSKSERNPQRERRLWHQPAQSALSLGCNVCPEKHICGGLRFKESIVFDCLQLCCNKPDDCDRVCRNNPDYPDRVREVGTFELQTIPRAPILVAPSLPMVVPIIYHRTSRIQPPKSTTVSLSLYSLLDRRFGLPRYTTREALCSAFCIESDSTILLTGTDRDPPLERWWELGIDGRRKIINAMNEIGIGLVTTPNFSLFIDRPRWNDLHAVKRIALIHEEFLCNGLPAALHVNGRTESDFERWAKFIRDREEITHLAYEFTTGTGWAGRQHQHALWLAELAGSTARPLHLVIRGGLDVLPILARTFAGLTVLDTSTFMKTIKRQRAHLKNNSTLEWKHFPTLRGAPLDGLFAENCRTIEKWIGNLITVSSKQVRKAG